MDRRAARQRVGHLSNSPPGEEVEIAHQHSRTYVVVLPASAHGNDMPGSTI